MTIEITRPEPTNAERAERVRDLVQIYADAYYGPRADLAEAAGDMLGDACHTLTSLDLDPCEALVTAYGVFSEEVADEVAAQLHQAGGVGAELAALLTVLRGQLATYQAHVRRAETTEDVVENLEAAAEADAARLKLQRFSVE